jgi:peptidoglycan/xylan/chitin deacetylase (PgdA/CDA1 family)
MWLVTDVLVLCYHAVSERWQAELSVTPTQLDRQIRALLRRGYRPVTFREAVAAPPSRKTLAVTFDDAYRSVYELGRPTLAKLGVPATVFVPTQLVDTNQPMAWSGIDHWRGGPDEHELVGMSWEQLGELVHAGWEVGSHTRTHPHLTSLGDDVLIRELRGSRDDCEARLGVPCLSLAYPYGDVDERVAAASGQAGYAAAGELSRRLGPPRPLRWPRIGIYHGDGAGRFWLKSSCGVRRLRTIASTRTEARG